MEERKKGPEMFDRISITYSVRGGLPSGEEKTIRAEGIFIGRETEKDRTFVSLKLKNGYNIGISEERIITMKVIEIGKSVEKRSVHDAHTSIENHVALLSTGGTISARIDYGTGAVRPAMDPEDLLRDIGPVESRSAIKPKIIRSILSEDMTVQDWIGIANEIGEAFSGGAVGCVVTHGTDTMSMTATALSFILRDLPGPVILVGSQRSSDRPSSDAFLNLKDALAAARTREIGEVMVLMHGSSSDDVTYLHRGNRVRKMHTSRRDSFRSVNTRPLGRIEDGKVILSGDHLRACEYGPRIVGGFDEKVILIKATPLLDSGLIDYAGAHYHALVIEGTGLGHVRSDLIPNLTKVIEEGVPVVMASSCPYGMVNMNVYATGRMLLSAGVIPAYDMTSEAAMIKTMYILNWMQKESITGIKSFSDAFLTDISGEMAMRTDISSFGSLGDTVPDRSEPDRRPIF